MGSFTKKKRMKLVAEASAAIIQRLPRENKHTFGGTSQVYNIYR